MIYPQLAATASNKIDLRRFIENPDIVFEQKLDGHRIMLVSPGEDIAPAAITRNGMLYSKKLPKAIELFRFPLSGGNLILDGELVGNEYWVFDLIVHGQTDMPLYQRRAALETFMDVVPNFFKLVPQAQTAEDKVKLADTAIKSNFEGLMLKGKNTPYSSGGRPTDWLKLKFTTTADVVVLDVRDDGKESVRLGLHDASGALVEVGRSSLIGKEKFGAISQGDVIEVRYLYTGANGRLYQPTIMRRRTDKGAVECTVDQLKPVNKSVLDKIA